MTCISKNYNTCRYESPNIAETHSLGLTKEEKLAICTRTKKEISLRIVLPKRVGDRVGRKTIGRNK